MPGSDLDALTGGGDEMVHCGTAIEAPPPDDPDVPPESIVLPVDDLEWADVVAVFIGYERDDSTKGSTNPKARAEQRQQHAQPKPLSASSQRFSGGLHGKPHIIGLPAARIEHHSGHLDRSGRRAACAPVFTKKLDGPENEPGSPKVSCMGKVLSERERDRCRRRHHGNIMSEEEQGSGPAGCWVSMLAAFCCVTEEAKTPGAETACTADEPRVDAKAAMEPPGMGAMRRFASRRRQVERDVDLEHVGEHLGGVPASVTVY